MKNILLLTLCCCFLLLGESCKKSSEPNPDVPYNPADELPDPYNNPNRAVLGCLINGEPWTPSWGFNNPSYSYHAPSGQLNMSGKDLSNDNYSHIAFAIKFSSTGNFKNLFAHPFANEELCSIEKLYTLDTTAYNNVVVDFYSEDDGVIIGTFDFTAINFECPDTVVVTDGRFKATL